jgi:hypothetical protein
VGSGESGGNAGSVPGGGGNSGGSGSGGGVINAGGGNNGGSGSSGSGGSGGASGNGGSGSSGSGTGNGGATGSGGGNSSGSSGNGSLATGGSGNAGGSGSGGLINAGGGDGGSAHPILPAPSAVIDPSSIDPSDPPRYMTSIDPSLIPQGWVQVHKTDPNTGEEYWTLEPDMVALGIMVPKTGGRPNTFSFCLMIALVICFIGACLILEKKSYQCKHSSAAQVGRHCKAS